MSISALSGSSEPLKVTAKSSQFTRILWLEPTTDCYGKYSSQSLFIAYLPEQTSVKVSEGTGQTKAVLIMSSSHPTSQRV